MARRKATGEGGDAKTGNIRVSLEGDEAKEFLKKTTEVAEPEAERTRMDGILGLLSDSGNKVSVKRISPRIYNGDRCNVKVYEEECPLSIDDIREFVFSNHGGHKYQLRVLDADNRVLDAIIIEHPDTQEPLIPEPTPEFVGGDPTSQDIPTDPLEAVDELLNKEVKGIERLQKIESTRETLKAMRQRQNDGRSTPAEDARVAALERRIEEMTRSNRDDAMAQRMDRMEKLIVESRTPVVDPEKEAIKKQLEEMGRKLAEQAQGNLLTAIISSSDKRFEQVMAMMQAALLRPNAAPVPNLDSDLERLLKLKNAMGKGEDRGAEFQDMIYDLAFSRLKEAGGAPPGEEDVDEENVVKYAIKQMVPFIKDWAKGRVDSEREKGHQVTQEDIQKIIKEEATRAAAQLEAQMRSQRHQVASPQQIPQLPVGHPAAAPPVASAPPVLVASPPSVPHSNPPQEIPMQPAQKPYSRKDAVNYVLNTIWSEMKQGFPDESVSVGDALDTWDDELLEAVEHVDSGDALEQVLRPYADPALWGNIHGLASSNDQAKRWLRRLVITVQDSWAEVKAERVAHDGVKAQEKA